MYFHGLCAGKVMTEVGQVTCKMKKRKRVSPNQQAR